MVVLPSSVHEMLILTYQGDMNLDDLSDIVKEVNAVHVIQLALHCFLLWLIAIGMLWIGRSKFWMIPKMEKGRAAQCT